MKNKVFIKILIIALASIFMLSGCNYKHEISKLENNILKLETTINELVNTNIELENINKELEDKIKDYDVDLLDELRNKISELEADINNLSESNLNLIQRNIDTINGFHTFINTLILDGFDLNTEQAHYIQLVWPNLYIVVNGGHNGSEEEKHLYKLDTKGSFENLLIAPVALDFRVSEDNKTIAVLTHFEYTYGQKLLFIDTDGNELKQFSIGDFDKEQLGTIYIENWIDSSNFIVNIQKYDIKYKININTWEITKY